MSMLVRALPEGTVRWGHRLQEIADDLVLHFKSVTATATVTGFDLIVGADGA